jgi:hypothetical protein
MPVVDMTRLTSRHLGAGVRTAHYIHPSHTLADMSAPGYWSDAWMVLPASTMLEVVAAGGLRASAVVVSSSQREGVGVSMALDGAGGSVGTGGPSGGPFSGQIAMVERCPRVSRWLGGWLYDPAQDEHILIESIGTGHVMDKGSMLIARKSQDGGDTLRGLRTIFSRASDPFIRASAFMRLPSGRIAGLVVTGENGARKLWGGISDDGLVTVDWTDQTSAMGGLETFVYSTMKPLPALAGGHDTLGAFVTSYGGASVDIKMLYTQDGGQTWAPRVLKGSAGLPSGAPQEATLEQLPSGHWFLAVRTSANTHAFGAIAPPDMSAFGPWIDLGVPLGSNIVEAYADGPYLHFLVMYRDGFPGSVDDNSIVEYRARADDVRDDPTVIGRSHRSIVATLPHRLIGYPQSCRRTNADGSPGPWSHVVVAEQGSSTLGGAGASLIVIRQIPGAVAGVSAAPVTRQHLVNPTFDSWPRGTSFELPNTPQVTAGRWYCNTSLATVTVSRVTVPDNVRYALPWWNAYGIRLQNPGSPNDYVGLWQGWLGDDAIPVAVDLCDRQAVTARVGGWGATPADLRGSFTVNGTSALRDGSGQFFGVPQGIEGAAPWLMDIDMRLKSLEDMAIAETAVTSCDFSIDNGRFAVEFDLQLAGALLITGPAPLEVPMPERWETDKAVRRYLERVAVTPSAMVGVGHARTTGIFWAALQYEPKVATPTVTTSAASDFQARAGGSDYAGTALAISNADRTRARVALTISGTMTTGHGGEIEVVSSPGSGAPFIEISCGR